MLPIQARHEVEGSTADVTRTAPTSEADVDDRELSKLRRRQRHALSVHP